MSERVFQIVRRGSWLYDHTVPAEVQIVRRNYFDGPKIVDEEPTPGYPPTDAEGCFYAIDYYLSNGQKGVCGEVFASLEDAAKRAEETLQSPIPWPP